MLELLPKLRGCKLLLGPMRLPSSDAGAGGVGVLTTHETSSMETATLQWNLASSRFHFRRSKDEEVESATDEAEEGGLTLHNLQDLFNVAKDLQKRAKEMDDIDDVMAVYKRIYIDKKQRSQLPITMFLKRKKTAEDLPAAATPPPAATTPPPASPASSAASSEEQ